MLTKKRANNWLSINKKQIPNLITISRAYFSFLSILFFCINHYTHNQTKKIFLIISIFLFFISIVTDFLDGYLARKWNAVTNFGKVYDPVIDKFLICGFLFIFNIFKTVNFWVCFLLIFRDISMDIIRIYFSRKSIIIPAIKSAKFKTSSQMMAIFLVLILQNFEIPKKEEIFIFLFIPSLLLSYYSFIIYIRNINNAEYKNT